jgi:hypothetical protein
MVNPCRVGNERLIFPRVLPWLKLANAFGVKQQSRYQSSFHRVAEAAVRMRRLESQTASVPCVTLRRVNNCFYDRIRPQGYQETIESSKVIYE